MTRFSVFFSSSDLKATRKPINTSARVDAPWLSVAVDAISASECFFTAARFERRSLRGSATLRRKGILFTRARSGGVYVHTARFLVTLLRAGRSYDGRRDDRRGKFTNLEPFFKPVDSFREARVTGDLRMISFPSTSLACLCL